MTANELTRRLVIPCEFPITFAYVPVSFVDDDVILGPDMLAIGNATYYEFGILSSAPHVAWLCAVAKPQGASFNYTTERVYNTFPWPQDITDEQRAKIENSARLIEQVRASIPDFSFAKHYTVDNMPAKLKEAHRANDEAVLDAYGLPPDASARDIVFCLKARYDALVKGQSKRGTTRETGRNTEMNNPLAQMKGAIEARVKTEPNNAEAWRELAQVKMMLGDAEGAENDCIESLRIDPKNAAALVLMGNLLTNMRGDDAAAEQYYVRAVEADDGFASAHANYGTLLLKRGEKMKAVTELRRSVELDGRQAVPRYMLAQAYIAISDWHSAWLVAKETLERGEVGFEDSANLPRVRDGLRAILDLAASKGGAEAPKTDDIALEQTIRQGKFDAAHADNDPARNLMMAMYMLDAMKRFESMGPDKVRNAAMEIAILGTHGIDPARTGGYTLKTIPGEDFSGYRLLAYYYVSWKMAFPDHLKDIGLPFDDAYALAVQMRGR